MISDEMDEDADLLDEEFAMVSLSDTPLRTTRHATGKPPQKRAMTGADGLPDWPPRRVADVGLVVDTGTKAWFEANHPDWRGEMRRVLRAWMVARGGATPASLGAGPCDARPASLAARPEGEDRMDTSPAALSGGMIRSAGRTDETGSGSITEPDTGSTDARTLSASVTIV